jgi:hypothetical protein
MRSVLSATVLALVVVLAGCSTPAEPEKEVATLETTGSSASATASGTPPTTASRPRERLDMTHDEIVELSQAYDQCLTKHGFGSDKAEADQRQLAEESGADESKQTEAETACLGRKPLPPWEYDTANSESADFVHAVVQCLRAKGVRYVEEAPATPGEDRRAISFGGPDNDSDSISKGLNLIGGCEKEQAHR